MATITTALDTSFTPSSGDFNIEVVRGAIVLKRRNTPSAEFAFVAELKAGSHIISNPVAGADYIMVRADSMVTPVVQVDQ
jgi:hypothetical protein